MSAPAWMPLYVADYLADTGHLSRDEHGAYMLLIMHYWQHGGLPDDDKKLARITQSANVDDWLSIRSAMAGLFGDNWCHKRIDLERSKAWQRIENRQKAGKSGGLASASKRQRLLKQTSTQSQSQSHIKKDTLATQELSEFDEKFWPSYPNKVGKPKARTSFLTARKANSLDVIMAGLERYKCDKPPDRPWLNPATFLNQERFNDEPASTGGNTHGQFGRRPPPGAQESPTRVALRIARGGKA